MFDSDTILLTDNQTLIRCASKYYNTFKVPTMFVDSRKRKRKYTNTDKAALDIFCDSDRIGVTVNLSQEINTIMWDRVNRYGDWAGAMNAYYDNCLLSILSTIEIDSAKKEYALDCVEELKIVRGRYNQKDKDGRAVRPFFFAHVAKKKGYYDAKHKCYKHHAAPMDYVQEIVNARKTDRGEGNNKNKKDTCTISDILNKSTGGAGARNGYVRLVLSMVRDMDNRIHELYQGNENVISEADRRLLISSHFNRCVESIKMMRLNCATVRDLLVAMDDPENRRLKRKLWSIILGSFSNEVNLLFREAKEPIRTIEECSAGEDGDVNIYWLKYRYVSA